MNRRASKMSKLPSRARMHEFIEEGRKCSGQCFLFSEKGYKRFEADKNTPGTVAHELWNA